MRINFVYVIGLLLFSACSDDNSKNPVEFDSYQEAIIFFDKSFRNSYIPFNPDYINVYGSITSDELPEIKYIKLGDSLSTELFDFQYNPGEITFKNKLGIKATQDSFYIEMESSHGVISGQIVLPDYLSNLSYGSVDSLNKGDSLILTWEQSNSDFYIIEFSYFYLDIDSILQRFTMDTLTELSSFEIKSNTLNYDGSLFLNIYPVNGPFPQKGTLSNMQGGFLYAINRGSINLIRIGRGLSIISPFQKRTLENRRAADKKKLFLSRLFEN